MSANWKHSERHTFCAGLSLEHFWNLLAHWSAFHDFVVLVLLRDPLLEMPASCCAETFQQLVFGLSTLQTLCWKLFARMIQVRNWSLIQFI